MKIRLELEVDDFLELSDYLQFEHGIRAIDRVKHEMFLASEEFKKLKNAHKHH